MTAFIPRKVRSKLLGESAYRAARLAGADVMGATLAQIGGAFGEAAAINSFKERVEFAITAGPSHRAVRARFGGRLELLNERLGFVRITDPVEQRLAIGAACYIVENWYRDERKAFQVAAALGRGVALPLMVLRELRLLLRLARRQAVAAYPVIVAAVLEPAPAPSQIAAE